ncbi:PhzF family phenazine biosynthesis protein [candidate division KSB1 bacterium]|nr:PhzF family phenazine biosynthesis protein [candidate division KSB1 bacterium]RQW00019.1 MAG: PhzF family phenazine biosynthesis protein [candidate division KSB1 bacterium]
MTKFYKVDAFTAEKFKGNPAAVVILQQAADETWMQHVAAEMNLSETAFVVATNSYFDLRWFTPRAEVDLCGHATLASAHVLFETAVLAHNEVARFQSKSGLLMVRKRDNLLEMDFPSESGREIPPVPILARALGCNPIQWAQNRMDVLVQVNNLDTLVSLNPDYNELAQIPVRGIIVTSQSNDGNYDFFSRFFAPRYGVNEDPVTGSAHCFLGPYWAAKLQKESLVGYQASQRGGIVRVKVKDQRVILGGHAVTVMRGELL